MYWNLSYSPETPNLGQIRRFLEPCDLEIWGMTLKNNRAPLLCYFKLCASFRSHWWIQTGVTVRKRLSWVVTSVTLTFDLWPWTFAWTLHWALVISPENFKMIRWWEHSQQDRRWNADKPSAALDPYIPTWLTTSPANHRPDNFDFFFFTFKGNCEKWCNLRSNWSASTSNLKFPFSDCMIFSVSYRCRK